VLTAPDAVRVLCFGDSNTHGVPGDDPEYVRLGPDVRWTGRLQRLLGDGYDVVEEGLSGRTTDVDYVDRPHCNGRTAFPATLMSHDPLDLAVVAAAALGGCIGFLWWNAHPARIMMGDTGSLALGGMIAGLSILTRTELLLVVIAGLFVVEMLSVVIQIAVFRTRHVRVFKMAPFHHHFELSGWAETTVMVRFWLLAAMSATLGLGLFYAEWLSLTGG